MKLYGEPIFGTVTERNPVVETVCGKVRGENREGVAIFRGIPYGSGCSGERRFLPAMPAENWDGIYDCTKNGYTAVQFGCSISGADGFGPYFSGGNPQLFGVEEEQQNEDCLVLNVVTPGIDDLQRPVVVYVHGGGFATGSGSLVLGADQWAREEDIVVVGINHRLNVFGYLHLGEFDRKYAESGMAGILDIVLALQWVQNNIAAFGGDPNKVTIMGESGGGMKVSNLLAMEKAKGLFRSAIVESGSSPIGRTGIQQGTKLAESILKELNLSKEHLNQLCAVPARELLEAAKKAVNGDMMQYSPVADEINLCFNPAEEFIAPEISAKIPLLVGASDDELAVFSPPSAFTITWDTLREALLTQNGNSHGGFLPPITEQNVDKIIEVFKKHNRKQDDAAHLYLKIISLSSFLGGGAFYQAMAKAKQGAAPVYHYMVAYDAPHPIIPEKKYAWHTADLPLQMRVVLHPECKSISKTMAHAWAAFIRSGNPSTANLSWPEFTTRDKQVMIFDDVCRTETDPYQEMREALQQL